MNNVQIDEEDMLTIFKALLFFHQTALHATTIGSKEAVEAFTEDRKKEMAAVNRVLLSLEKQGARG